jgi:hypothetical protein
MAEKKAQRAARPTAPSDRAPRREPLTAPVICGHPNTSHDLRVAGAGADGRDRAVAWFRDKPSFKLRSWTDSDAPHALASWISYEDRGPRPEDVLAFAAENPDLSIVCCWYDGGLDDGERIVIEGGAAVSRQDTDYQTAYAAVYGRLDDGYTPHELCVPESAVGRPVAIADAALGPHPVTAKHFRVG